MQPVHETTHKLTLFHIGLSSPALYTMKKDFACMGKLTQNFEAGI